MDVLGAPKGFHSEAAGARPSAQPGASVLVTAPLVAFPPKEPQRAQRSTVDYTSLGACRVATQPRCL